MTRKIHHIWLLLLILVATQLKAQQVPFQSYTLKDGLPDMECYNLLQDSIGYAWVGTNSGLYRFDGENFKHYTNSTLNDVPVFTVKIFRDKVFCVVDRKGIFLVQGDSLYQPEKFKRLYQETARNGSSMLSWGVESNEKLWIGYVLYPSPVFQVAFAEIDKDLNYNLYKDNYTEDEMSIRFFENEERVFSMSAYRGNSKVKIMLIDGSTGNRRQLMLGDKQKGYQIPAVRKSNNGTIAVVWDMTLTIIHLDKSVSIKLDHSVNANGLYFENDTILWLAQTKRNAIRLKISSSSFKIEETAVKLVPNASSFWLGKSGLWITSLSSGIKLIPNLGVLNMVSDAPVTGLCLCNNQVFYSSQKNIIRLAGTLVKDTVVECDFEVRGLFCEGKTLVAESFGGHGWKYDKITPIRQIGYGGQRRIYKLNDSTIQRVTRTTTTLVGRDTDTTLGATSTLGTRIFDRVPVKPFYQLGLIDNQLVGVDITDSIAKIEDISIDLRIKNLIGRYRNRVLVSDFDGILWSIDSFLNAEKITGPIPFLKLSKVVGYEINGLGEYLFCRMGSMMKLNMDSKAYKIFTGSPQIFTGETKSIFNRGDELIWMNNGGIYSSSTLFNDESYSISAPLIEGYNNLKPDERIQLDYERNSLDLTLSKFNFTYNPYVKYYVDIEDDNAVTTYPLKSNQLFLPDLPIGDLSLKIYAEDIATGAKSPSTRLPITVEGPIWTKWWFICILVLVVVLPSGLFFYQRNRSIRVKNQLTKNILKLRSQAIETQLNPHFIFNALGSIQFLIATGKNDEADEYLSNFSFLLRNVVENSTKMWHPFRDEHGFLKAYVSLENLRFKKDIKLEFQNHTGIGYDQLLVPPMLLQVLIENSIVHGFKKEQDIRKVRVTASLTEKNRLILECMDNGGGFPESKIKEKSRGISLVRGRLFALAQREKSTYKFDYGNMAVVDDFKACSKIELPLKTQNL